MRGTMAVFLAGGRESGLGVLTGLRAAAAMPFGGKYRLVDFSLSNSHHSEIFQVALLTQHAPTSLNEHVGSGRPWDLDRSAGVQMLQPYALRERAAWYAGASDAVLRNLGQFEEMGALRIVVGCAEHVYLLDYSSLVAAHLESRCPITVVATPVDAARAARCRLVHFAGNRLIGYEHYPTGPAPGLASMGLYVFEMDYLREFLVRGHAPEGGRSLARHLIEPSLRRGVPVNLFRFDGEWADPSDLESYYRTSMALLAPQSPLRLADPTWPVETRAEERPPARFGPDARARRSIVAAGAIVEGEVEGSIIFGGARIAAGARVTRSIVFQDAHIHSGAQVDTAILDKLVEIGCDARVGAEGADAAAGFLATLCVLGKEARLPDGFRLAPGAGVSVGGAPSAGAADAVHILRESLL